MKYATIAAILSVAAAAPQPIAQQGPGKPPKSSLTATINDLRNSKGELDAGFKPLIRNEIIDSTPCGKVAFIFARASKEPTNMGGSMGPIVCNGLKEIYGAKQVLCQGVGGAYSAGLFDNVGSKGTTAGAIREATKMFTTADTKCPNAILTFGGYSQGTAVMHNTVSTLPQKIKDKIVAGVLFGDTKNTQDRGQVPKFPKDRVQIYCAKSDGVCWGTLAVTNGHFVYTSDGSAKQSLDFLKGKIDAKLGTKSGAKGRKPAAEELTEEE